MRLAFALLPALLLAACASPQGERIHARQVARADEAQGLAASSSRTRGGTWSGYHQDEATEANCYAVFGQLRCERVQAHRARE